MLIWRTAGKITDKVDCCFQLSIVHFIKAPKVIDASAIIKLQILSVGEYF